MRLVGFLRASIFSIFVSLMVLTGYGVDVLDCACDEPKKEMTDHAKGIADKGKPAQDEQCQCICHQIFIAETNRLPQLELLDFLELGRFRIVDEFPPDSAPLGIEYPPQLV